MPKIHSLKIKNFRGIKDFEGEFWNDDFVCLIGRGDSGKTTILKAIHYLLYPTWRENIFSDSDFHNLDLDNNIVIQAVLGGIPQELLTENKFGLHKVAIDKNGNYKKDIPEEEHTEALIIRLEVDKSLDPEWKIINPRYEEEIKISYRDRKKLNIYLISEYEKFHFNWSKRSPLYSLAIDMNEEDLGDSLFSEMVRSVVGEFKEKAEAESEEIGNKITEEGKKLGLELEEVRVYPKIKNHIKSSSSFALHDDGIPMELNGKGSKRLVSIAIQKKLCDDRGIILVDEIEQGLEPDRVKNLIRNLRYKSGLQVFTTTHSQNVIEELGNKGVFKLKKNDEEVEIKKISNKKVRLIRKFPEAFYAKKIVLCEGKTEIGLCRAIESNYLKNKDVSLASKGVVYVNSKGDEKTLKDAKDIVEDGLIEAEYVVVFCDSDNDSKEIKLNGEEKEIRKIKEELEENGIKIFDWEQGFNVEKRIFEDIPSSVINCVFDYLKSSSHDDHGEKGGIKGSLSDDFIDKDNYNQKEVDKIITEANNQGWFKKIETAEKIGNIILNNKKEIGEEKEIIKGLNKIKNWMYGIQ